MGMLSSLSSKTVAVTLFINALAYGAEGDIAGDDNAANSSDTYTLSTYTVHGKKYHSTGTKSDLKPLQSPMSYEVYDSQLLQRRQVDSVNEALRYVTGITAESRGTVSIFDQYTIRGFQTYYNYYDGLPLLSNKSWNLYPQVDAFATSSIEVLKGPTSVLYGAAPAGGMVNQVAKEPIAKKETLIRTRLGS
ncbi:MAG: TonB-dependent receptor plug domain-containing protein, partial [Endozoicomonas sp. (ex Botrylloides leachii)]|nr:TonB-dependent receptor plug domain-containing protein [Endozoicomonas sp. (ex Botrylloides leachii)]